MFGKCCGESPVVEEIILPGGEVRAKGTRMMAGKGTPVKLTVVTTSSDPAELADDDDSELGGTMEPPVTPVGRDELALRRHRFFNDLMAASQGIHRVRFDPRGPSISGEQEEVISHCHELEALVGRLEAVTTRLEDALSQASSLGVHDICFDVSRSVSPAPVPNMSSQGYRDIVQGPLSRYVQISQQIGGHVAQHANLVLEAFNTQLSYIELAGSRPEPGQGEQVNLLSPTSSKIQAIQALRETNRTSEFFNHLSAISESIPALGWVTVKPAPAPYVKEMNDAGQFYTNRVLKDWKEKDKKHVEWVKAWVETLSELQKYVKTQHTTGLVWAKGGSGPPPPPPGGLPPPPPPIEDLSLDAGSTDERSALFAQINQGENITRKPKKHSERRKKRVGPRVEPKSGVTEPKKDRKQTRKSRRTDMMTVRDLKKVTSEMQTHKNPGLRSGPAPFKAPAQPTGATHVLPGAPKGATTVKPPLFTRDGKKWLIEHQKGNQSLVVDNADMNNVVYMFGCVDSTLTVKGKINSVFLDSCKRTSVLFDSLVSSVEFVNCQSVQMQVLGKVPTITIDKTDGCQMYLSKDSLDVEIVSSKSSEMNVLIPTASGEFTEHPIPEQYKTLVVGKGLSTTPVESKG